MIINALGGYGSSYGGYGGGYGTGYGTGYSGGYGYNRPGMGMGPEDASLTARLEQSTQRTFQTLEQIVQVRFYNNYFFCKKKFKIYKGFWRICSNVRINFFCYPFFIYGHGGCC